VRLLALLVAALALAGCGMQRTLHVDSVPTGARAWVDGVPRGTTPITIPYAHPGTWHVRLEKPGYRSLATDVSVASTTADLPLLDLPSEVLGGRRQVRRTLTLEPLGAVPGPAELEALRDRAREFRQRAYREVAEPGTPAPRGVGR
jgi:hypothetical protein